MRTPKLPVYLLGMSGVQSNRAKFLKYRHLHEELKSVLEGMGWPVSNDGQLFAFSALLQSQPKAKKPAPAAEPSPATVGRRAVARGDRPPMKEAIARVMGKKVMSSSEVIAALGKMDWLPNTQPDKTQQYISFILSSTTDLFKRVSRGNYKNTAQGAKLAAQAAKAQKGSKSTRARGSA